MSMVSFPLLITIKDIMMFSLKIFTPFLLTLFTLSLLSCNGKNQVNEVLISNIFTENSEYQIVDFSDGQGIMKFRGCTGFLVKNSLNKTIVASARHCFDFKPRQWCLNGGKSTHFSTGTVVNCLKVAIGSEDGPIGHDLVLFEMEKIDRDHGFDFILSTKIPNMNDEIYMLGFPVRSIFGDRGKGKLIKTFNCFVNSEDITPTWVPTQLGRDFTYNCGTDGGNSGGPIALLGTRVVIGLPNLYRENSTPSNPLPSSTKIKGRCTNWFLI